MGSKNKMRTDLEKLILSSYEAMYRVAYTYMKNEQDSMDVVHDSIVKAFKSVNQLNDADFMKTWLFRIVICTALDELRRRKKVIPLVQEIQEGREDYYSDPDVIDSLKRLEESEKQVIVLRYCEEWKLEEIAEYMGKNQNTVKSILYRSLKKLKKDLARGEAVL